MQESEDEAAGGAAPDDDLLERLTTAWSLLQGSAADAEMAAQQLVRADASPDVLFEFRRAEALCGEAERLFRELRAVIKQRRQRCDSI